MTMTMTMTIDQFNALLHGQQDDSGMMKMLRQIVTIGKPQDIQRLLIGTDTNAGWWGWG